MNTSDISIYLEAVSVPGFPSENSLQGKRIGDLISTYTEAGKFPDLEGVDLAFFGVLEDRNSVSNEGCGFGVNPVREELYKLFPGTYDLKIADLGNIRQGYSIEDTYYAVSEVLAWLITHHIMPVFVGGGQDLTFAHYQAYEKLSRIINIVAIDPVFDLGHSEDQLDSRSYLSRIILQQPNFLFNYTNLGYQSYFVAPEAVNLVKNLFFDAYRLGVVRSDMEEVEPVVRNADMVSVDISSVRRGDAPGSGNAGPNGFSGEELCKMVRYAGLSDKLSSIGFYEYNPMLDEKRQTALLLAQAIWYFIEGYYNRQHDYPKEQTSDYVKFTVTTSDFQDEILFFKSKKSERWWMKVPVKAKFKERYQRHYMVPCSYRDYQSALSENIPDRWWQTYQKLM